MAVPSRPGIRSTFSRPEGFIKDKTVLVLTDALYLTARWATPFGKYRPVHRTFTRLDGGKVHVEFMHELELADRRGAGTGFLAAKIPYLGNEFSMLVIVPDRGRFAALQDGLDQAFLDAIDATFTTGPTSCSSRLAQPSPARSTTSSQSTPSKTRRPRHDQRRQPPAPGAQSMASTGRERGQRKIW